MKGLYWTRRLSLLAVVGLCIGGAAISGELLKQHAGNFWGAAESGGLLQRACEAAAAAGFDCAGARHNRWSEVRVPLVLLTSRLALQRTTVVVPVAFLGLSYFVCLGMWFVLLGGPRPIGRRWHRLPLALATLGTAASALFVGLMAAGQAPWCLLCILVHGLNAALVLLVWRICRGPRVEGHAPAPASTPARWAAMTLTGREVARALAVMLLVIAGLWVYRREQLVFRHEYAELLPYRAQIRSFQADPEFLLREFYARPRHAMDGRGAPPEGGRPCLVIFTDYQCDMCACHTRRLQKQVEDAFGGRLAVSVHHYPLCSDCNPQVDSQFHPQACEAARAAEAARLAGGDAAFWRMHELLFAYRKHLSTDTYRQLAERTGLDGDRLLRDMRSEPVRSAVQADVSLARELGVTRTPTLFLDGRLVPDVCQTPVFWQAVARTVADQRTAAAGP